MAQPRPERKRPGSIRQVAELAGVSIGTVSNVMNSPHLVAEATRLRVEEAIRATGFVRNAAARQLRGIPSTDYDLWAPSLVSAVLIIDFSFCSPSRGPTSVM